MSAKEKRWKRIYLFLFILVYGLAIPINLLVFLTLEGESFPFVMILVGVILPIIKKQHIERLRTEGA